MTVCLSNSDRADHKAWAVSFRALPYPLARSQWLNLRRLGVGLTAISALGVGLVGAAEVGLIGVTSKLPWGLKTTRYCAKDSAEGALPFAGRYSKSSSGVCLASFKAAGVSALKPTTSPFPSDPNAIRQFFGHGRLSLPFVSNLRRSDRR